MKVFVASLKEEEKLFGDKYWEAVRDSIITKETETLKRKVSNI